MDDFELLTEKVESLEREVARLREAFSEEVVTRCLRIFDQDGERIVMRAERGGPATIEVRGSTEDDSNRILFVARPPSHSDDALDILIYRDDRLAFMVSSDGDSGETIADLSGGQIRGVRMLGE